MIESLNKKNNEIFRTDRLNSAQMQNLLKFLLSLTLFFKNCIAKFLLTTSLYKKFLLCLNTRYVINPRIHYSSKYFINRSFLFEPFTFWTCITRLMIMGCSWNRIMNGENKPLPIKSLI